MEKPLLKITFKEPIKVWQDSEVQTALYMVVKQIEYSKVVSNILADGNVLSLKLIKSIEFIQPTDLK